MWTNSIWDDMDRLLGSTMGLGLRPSAASIPFPPLNLFEDDGNFYVEAELPGMTQEQIEITVAEGDQLTIAGQRQPVAVPGSVWHRQESGSGRFSRTVTLPVVVDSSKVEACCQDGVLTITLPKSAMAKPRRVAVKSVATS
jgi:HSP20 family protein